MIVAGIDPGTTNFGYAVVNERGVIVHCGSRVLCPHKWTHQRTCDAVIDFVGELLVSHGATHVSIEAQMRAKMHCVAASVYTVAALCGCDSEIVHASHWRARLRSALCDAGDHDTNKLNSVEFVYGIYKRKFNSHTAEAILMALGRICELKRCTLAEILRPLVAKNSHG